MKKYLIFIFILCTLGFQKISYGIPLELVEINLQILNYSKRAKVFFEHFERPFSIPPDGKMKFYAIKKDTIKIEVHSIGFKKVVLNIDPSKMYAKKDSNIPYSTSYVVDFKHELYYGMSVNEKKLTESICYPEIRGWVTCLFKDKITRERITNTSIGIVAKEFYSEYENKFEVFRASNGFCFPLFDNSELVLLSEKDGYFTAITEISRAEFAKSEKVEPDIFLLHKNVLLEKNETANKYVTSVLYCYRCGNLDFVHNSEVFSTPTMRRTTTENLCYYTEPLLNEGRIFTRFIHPQYGRSSLMVEKHDNLLFISKNNDRPDTLTVGDFNKPFSLVQLIHMGSSMGWKNTRLTDIFSGEITLTGRIIDSINKTGVANAKVFTNQGDYSLYTDFNGDFEFKDIPSRPDSLQVVKAGFVKKTVSLTDEIGREIEIQITPHHPGSAIKGTLYSYKTHKIIPNFPLYLRGTYNKSITDENGHFEFCDLPPGDYMIIAQGTPIFGCPVTVPSDRVIHHDLIFYPSSRSISRVPAHQNFGVDGLFLAKIIDYESGLGVDNVNAEFSPTINKKSDYSGFLEIAGIQNGYYDIKLSTDNYFTKRVDSLFFEDSLSNNFTFQIKSSFPDRPARVFEMTPRPKPEPENQRDYEFVSREIIQSNNGDKQEVKGHIYSSENSARLLGVNLIFENTFVGCASSFEGAFVITNSPSGKQRLRVSASGFKTKVIDLDIKEDEHIDLNIFMESSIKNGTETEQKGVFIFGGFIGDQPTTIHWFLEGCLMTRIYDESREPLSSRLAILKYVNNPKTEEMCINIKDFGIITLNDTLNSKNEIYLSVHPDSGLPFTIRETIEHDKTYPFPFLLFDFIVEENDSLKRIKHYEMEIIHYPPTNEQLLKYPWMEQQILY